MELQTQHTLQRSDGTSEMVTEDGIRERVRAGGLLFEIMGREGDVKKIWDPTKSVEVDDARRSFDDLTKKGYRAYRCVGDKGDQGEQMKTFDGAAGRVIFVPAMQGG